MTNLDVMLPWFAAASSLVVLVFLLVVGKKGQVEERLEHLASGRGAQPGPMAAGRSVLIENPVDQLAQRRMRREERKASLKDRLMQAGIYGSGATGVFAVVRIVMLAGPAVLGYLAAEAGMTTLTQGLLFGALAGVAGTMAPIFWLDHVKRLRQTQIRRSLPDALDVLVVCLEGGMSLNGSFARVAHELATAHPMLAVELQIVQRQTQMGRSTGEAVREFAKRFDLEELRSMASVIIQSEKIGSSVVTALTVYAETLRTKRFQRAEELAQRAVIKVLFPTVFFIFPGMFVVLLGPAAIQVWQAFEAAGIGR
jgi:tight adherence protein C